MDDFCYLTLHCKHCENTDCPVYPIGYYIRGDEGCTRQVSFDDAEQYYHITQEELPFIKYAKTSENAKHRYKKVDDFLDYIYHKPFGQKLNRNGEITIK